MPKFSAERLLILNIVYIVFIKRISLVMGIVFILLVHGSIYAQQTAFTSFFSVQVPTGWVYKENFETEHGIILFPNEYASMVAGDSSRSLLDLVEYGILMEFAPDPHYHTKNASLEKYVKQFLSFGRNYDPKIENATIGGEKAIKIFINGTDAGKNSPMKKVTGSINSISYRVVHQGQPYYLYYIANQNNYKKYLLGFEQIVKTFRFTK
ncbi:hypothetical protein BH18THE1_BH18THE1_12040 [soil metagenome]